MPRSARALGGWGALPFGGSFGGLKPPIRLLAEAGLHGKRVVAPVVEPVADFQRQAAVDGRLQRDVRRRILGNVRSALDLFFKLFRKPIERDPARNSGGE